MEDYAPVIWVFIVVGAMILNAVSKVIKKSTADTPDTQPPHPHTEAWPMGDDTPERTYEPANSELPLPTRKQLSRQSSAPLTAEHHQAMAPTHHTAYQAAGQATDDRAFTEAYADQTDAITELQTIDNPLEESNNAPLKSVLAEDFDLQKAIIYSEILKPKFND